MPGVERVLGGSKVRFWVNCKEASELASRAMDATLPLSSRFALKLHHNICENCARFALQLTVIRRLMKTDEPSDTYEATLSQEAKHRIETELQKKLD
jgi:hypothetical protein